jgi:DNA-binding IclR family transcriptional regulator
MRSQEPATPTATAVKRALEILECLDASRRPLNVSEISRKLNLPKSSTHVIALTLERLGYIERQPGGIRYSLGLKTHLLGQGLMRTLVLSNAAQPHMRRLAEELHMPAHLAIPDNDQGVFIQKVDAPGAARFDTYVGRRIDLHCTAVGKVILAFGPEDVREHVLNKPVYVRHTNHTLTSPQALSRELRIVRSRGFGFDNEEEELDVRCAAVPVFDDLARFLAGLSVTGTVSQITSDTLDSIVSSLKRTAANIGLEKPQAVSNSA